MKIDIYVYILITWFQGLALPVWLMNKRKEGCPSLFACASLNPQYVINAITNIAYEHKKKRHLMYLKE
jgi:hypothetical protein